MDVEEFYSREAHRYDELRWRGPIGEYVHRQYERLVLECVPQDENAKYLEIGCGTGRFTALFAAQGLDLTAIDISDEMIAATQAKLNTLGHHKRAITLKKADARSTGMADSSFDVVFSFNVINHVPRYQEVIREVARVLKADGIFVVGYPSLWSVYAPYALIVNATGRSLRRGVYTRWPSTPALIRLAEHLGMRLQKQRGMMHFPAIRNVAVARPIASLLRSAGELFERGALQSLASTRILVFRLSGK
jgi:2-polyprenyl-3-methyl-5-hydroxy-6-metoxy-1,4-benzoquinol methylase